jgi:hypothetical protein
MKKITAKFNSTCAETGRQIKKGETMIYDYATRSCYSVSSSVFNNFGMDKEGRDTRDMVQANEDAYFDSFCYNNNI